MSRYLLVVAYLTTIPAANWFIGHVGACSDGVCVVPVWPGIYAPSGVLFIGIALWLRDEVQRRPRQFIPPSTRLRTEFCG